MSEQSVGGQSIPKVGGLEPDSIPRPQERWSGSDPEAMHTFAHPTTGVADHRSFNGFVEYSVDRFEGVIDARASMVAATVAEPYVQAQERRRTTGWGINKWATATALVGCAIVNANNIIETAKTLAPYIAAPLEADKQDAGQAAPESENPGPTEIRHLLRSYEQFNMQSGGSAPDPKMVKKAVQAATVSGSTPDCTKTISVSVIGMSSDEWGGRSSLGHSEPQNEQLSLGRASDFVEAMKQEAEDEQIALPPISISGESDILTQEDIDTLDTLLAANGYASGDGFLRAMRDYNQDANRLPAQLRTYFDKTFGSQRGVEVVIEKGVCTPDVTPPITNEEAPSGNTLPDDWNLWPLLLAAVPRRKSETVMRTSIGYRPAPLADHGRRTVSVKLYPEALKADGKTLVPDAWAYTRKYQMLLREGRVKGVLRFNYGERDENGEQQALRVLFVDKQPQPEFIKHLAERLGEFSLMQGGKLGSRINAITIFPSENAGHAHHNPSKVGLGIDQQYETGVLGVTMPMLGLVEMHMDTDNHSPKSLEDAFMGPDWTLSHEVAGHGTDMADNPHTLKALDEPGEYAYDGSPWQDAGIPAPSLGIRKNDRFVVPDPEKPGETLVVTGNDPRIQVNDPILLNRPTQYSNSSVAELHAEIAATTQTTDGRIPASQLPATPGDQTEDYNPANNQYVTNPDLRNEFQRHVGSVIGSDGLEWNEGKLNAAKKQWRAHYAPAEWDPEVRKLIAEARSTRLPQDKDLLSIIGEEAI